jgi:hypothetical protein
LTQEGLAPQFMGRRDECPEACSWKNIKSNHKPSKFSLGDSENNEMFLEKKEVKGTLKITN